MILLSIDPGPTESAWVKYSSGKLLGFGKWENKRLLEDIWNKAFGADQIAMETIKAYGMAVGETTFETCRWEGKFELAAQGMPVRRIRRLDVKLHICKSPKANDTTIRQALIDRYGPSKEKAIGSKKSPGPLFGISADVWSALAIAITATETKDELDVSKVI